MVCDNPSIVAHKIAFQILADGLVEVVNIIGCDAVAVWRVGNDDGFVERLLKLMLHTYHIFHTSILHIFGGYLHYLTIYVVAINLMIELTLLTIIIVDIIEEVGIKILPFLESILLAEHAWIDVHGYKGCFNQDGT